MRIVTGHRPDKLYSKTFRRAAQTAPRHLQASLVVDGVPVAGAPETRYDWGHDGYEWGNPLREHLRARFRTVLLSLAADAWCRGDRGVEVVTGGAIGWDQDAAGVALRAGVPYALYQPFVGQESVWPAESRAVYAELVRRASRVVLLCPERPADRGHAGRLLLDRNKALLVPSVPEPPTDVVVAVWDGSSGGTSHCVRHAESLGIPVVNLLGSDRKGFRTEPGCREEYAAQRARAARDGVLCF
jgi:hypothetical protein